MVLGLGLARVVSGFLYGVRSWDPVTVLSATGILLTVSALAAWIPARRASRVDPVRALRAE